MEAYHETVMRDEVLAVLAPERGGVYVDGTLGGGGHAFALLEAAEAASAEVRLVGVDRDPEALAYAGERLACFGDRVTLVQANYGELVDVLEGLGLSEGVDGVVVDAGVSSHQLDTAGRGFSFMREGPLDMRMGDEGETALELLERLEVRELASVLGRWGEVKGAGRLARKIKTAVDAGEVTTTLDLARLCGTPRAKDRIHPATRVFQALRIAVNGELDGLESLVSSLPEVLRVGGRAAVISFHSLEDRIVKQGLRRLARPCVCPPKLPVCVCGEVVRVKPLGKLRRPTDDEVARNPRARSARLRCAERVAEGA